MQYSKETSWGLVECSLFPTNVTCMLNEIQVSRQVWEDMQDIWKNNKIIDGLDVDKSTNLARYCYMSMMATLTQDKINNK